MALRVVDDKSKVTSAATATVTVESDETNFSEAQSELSLDAVKVAMEWARKEGISSPGLGGTKEAPHAINHKGEEIGTEHYMMEPHAPARQVYRYRTTVPIHAKIS